LAGGSGEWSVVRRSVVSSQWLVVSGLTATRFRPKAQGCRLGLPWIERHLTYQPQRGCVRVIVIVETAQRGRGLRWISLDIVRVAQPRLGLAR